MAKQSNQKAKLLYLQKILMEETDAAHGITIAGMVERLAAFGVAAERKSLYDDIEVLRGFGMDIATERGRANSYKLISRGLTAQEVAAICLALQQTGFAQAEEITGKLCSLLSCYEAEAVKEELAVAAEEAQAAPAEETAAEPEAAETEVPQEAETADEEVAAEEAEPQAEDEQLAAEAEIAAAVLEEEKAIEAEAAAMRKAAAAKAEPEAAAEEIELKCDVALKDEVLAYLGDTAKVVKTKSSSVVIEAQAVCSEDFYVQLIKWGSGVKLSEPSYRRKEFVKYFKKILSNYK